MRGRNLIVAAVVLLVIAGVTAALVSNKSNNNSNTKTNTSTNEMKNMPSSNQSTNNSSEAVETTAVKISNFSFSPATIKVKLGQTVTWTNEDSASHSVVADSDPNNGPNSQLLAKGQTYSYTFNTAGTFKYHCSVHPSMKATVIVQ